MFLPEYNVTLKRNEFMVYGEDRNRSCAKQYSTSRLRYIQILCQAQCKKMTFV